MRPIINTFFYENAAVSLSLHETEFCHPTTNFLVIDANALVPKARSGDGPNEEPALVEAAKDAIKRALAEMNSGDFTDETNCEPLTQSETGISYDDSSDNCDTTLIDEQIPTPPPLPASPCPRPEQFPLRTKAGPMYQYPGAQEAAQQFQETPASSTDTVCPRPASPQAPSGPWQQQYPLETKAAPMSPSSQGQCPCPHGAEAAAQERPLATQAAPTQALSSGQSDSSCQQDPSRGRKRWDVPQRPPTEGGFRPNWAGGPTQENIRQPWGQVSRPVAPQRMETSMEVNLQGAPRWATKDANPPWSQPGGPLGTSLWASQRSQLGAQGTGPQLTTQSRKCPVSALAPVPQVTAQARTVPTMAPKVTSQSRSCPPATQGAGEIPVRPRTTLAAPSERKAPTRPASATRAQCRPVPKPAWRAAGTSGGTFGDISNRPQTRHHTSSALNEVPSMNVAQKTRNPPTQAQSACPRPGQASSSSASGGTKNIQELVGNFNNLENAAQNEVKIHGDQKDALNESMAALNPDEKHRGTQ